MPDQDTLSGEDLAALTETYRHLRDTNDPRADKLRMFIGQTVKGGNFEPMNPKNPDHAGFFSSLGSDLWGIVKGATDPKTAATNALTLGIPVKQTVEAISNAPQRYQEQSAAGRSMAYKATAPIAEMTGANVRGMEQSADQGDIAGVAGHASAVPVAMAATAAAAKGIPTVARTVAPNPEALYQSALKPSTTLSPEARTSIIQTGLKNEIPVSPAGAEKISGLIDDLNTKIKDTIDTGQRQGVTVNKFKVASRLGETADKFKTQVNPTSDLEAISQSGNEFLENQPGQIPAADAQALKQGTYRQLKGKAYGELKGASIEAQKALARGIKEELANAFPELKDLNQAESKLFQLTPEIERAIGRQGNHQLMGIGTPAVTGAAKMATGSTGIAAAAGAIKAIVDNPIVKSRIAIALNRRGIPMATANARIAAYSAALAAASQQNDDQGNQQ